MLAAGCGDGRKQHQSAESYPEETPSPSCWQRAAELALSRATSGRAVLAVSVGAIALQEPRLEASLLPFITAVWCLPVQEDLCWPRSGALQSQCAKRGAPVGGSMR